MQFYRTRTHLSYPEKLLLVSEKQIVNKARDNQIEEQPIANDQTLTSAHTPHLCDLLFDRGRSCGGRGRDRNNDRGGGDRSTDLLGVGRGDFFKVCQDCSGSGSSSGSRCGSRNYSAQRGDDHTIDFSGEDSGGKFDGLDVDGLQLITRSNIGSGGTTGSRAGQSGEVDRGGHSVEDRLGDGGSSGRLSNVLGTN